MLHCRQPDPCVSLVPETNVNRGSITLPGRWFDRWQRSWTQSDAGWTAPTRGVLRTKGGGSRASNLNPPKSCRGTPNGSKQRVSKPQSFTVPQETLGFVLPL